jgi:hypothetical protein
MQAVQVLRDYNAQAPKKTKTVVSQIVAVVIIGVVLVCIYKFAYIPIRKSSVMKEIANLQADLGTL